MTDTIELSEVQFSNPTSLSGRSDNSINRKECEVLRFDDGLVAVKRRIKANARGSKLQRIPLHNIKSMTYLSDDPEAQALEQQQVAEQRAKNAAAAKPTKGKGGKGKSKGKPKSLREGVEAPEDGSRALPPESSTEARRG